jgi:hypothetical protein
MFMFERTQALKAAIELDLFTAITGGATRVPEIASRVKAAERGIRILCDFLTIHGFLTKSGNAYAVSPQVAPFLEASYADAVLRRSCGKGAQRRRQPGRQHD